MSADSCGKQIGRVGAELEMYLLLQPIKVHDSTAAGVLLTQDAETTNGLATKIPFIKSHLQ
jgi:hypothetical protein